MKLNLFTLAPLFALMMAPVQSSEVWAQGVSKSGGWTDYNKTSAPGDDYLCWAAASSNVINHWQSRYWIDSSIPTGEAIWNKFKNSVSRDSGGSFSPAFQWWLTGDYEGDVYGRYYYYAGDVIQTDISKFAGYYFDTCDLSTDWSNNPEHCERLSNSFWNVSYNTSGSSNMAKELVAQLSSGAAICLSIADQGGLAHAITLWGVEYSVVGGKTKITKLWLVDSDDHQYNVNTQGLFSVDVQTDSYGNITFDDYWGNVTGTVYISSAAGINLAETDQWLHGQTIVNTSSDVISNRNLSRSMAYRFKKSVTLSGMSSALMSASAGNQYYASFAAASPVSLTFSNATAQLFNPDADKSLEMRDFKQLNFKGVTLSSSFSYGGIIHAGNNSSVTIHHNSEVKFDSNAAYCGGALQEQSAKVNFTDNGTLTFSGNKAEKGGAIDADGGTVTISRNSSVSFSGNQANASLATGAAIYARNGATILMSDNGSVTFSGNRATGSSEANGGAVYSQGSTLKLQNNGSVLFENNAEVRGGTYRLRSLNSGNLYLSAAAGKTITFRDSISVASGSTVSFNADYTNSSGQSLKQTGDILFTGAYTASHLNTLKGSAATASELTASRTSQVSAITNLYGGQLKIEDGAIYSGRGFNAASNSSSALSLKDAAFNHSNYNMTFNSGTTLNLSGANNISGNLRLNSGSNLKLNLESKNSSSPLVSFSSASLTLGGTINISILPGSNLSDGTYYKIFSGISKPSTWTSSNINLIIPENCRPSTSILSWSGNELTFYYDVLSATWSNASGNGTWDTSSTNWTDNNKGVRYENKSTVTFNSSGAGTVNLVGTLAPKSVTVNNGSGYNYTWQGSGKLSGTMKLYKKGTGTLTIKNTNTFTGGAEITGGKVVLNAENALGTGAISVSDAELSATSRINAQGLTLKNSKMTQTGGGTGLTLKSSMTMENSDLVLKAPLNGTFLTMTKGSSINMLDSCTRNITLSGTLNATDSDITMYGHTQTNNLTLKNSSYTSVGGASRDLKVTDTLSLSSGAKLRHHGAIHAKKVSLNSSNITQTGGGKGLNLSGALSLSNKATVSLKGPLTASSVTLAGSSVLDSVDQYSRQVTLSGSMSATDSTVKLYGNVEMNALTLKNSAFDMDGKYTRSLTLKSGSTFTNSKADLYGFLTGTNLTLNNSTLNQRGGSAGLQLSGALSMSNNAVLNLKSPLKAASANLSSGAKLNMQDSVTRAITLTGSMSATKATVNHYGKLKAANLTLTDSTYNCTGRYATGMDISGTTKLTNSKLDIYGYLNSKNLTLSKGRVRQSGTGNVTISGTLSMNSGSSLTTSGTLSAGTMTLSGGTINLTAGSLKTITVNNTLTLNSAIDLNLGCSLKQGVSYKLVSFKKTNLTKTSNLASLLGMSGSGATLTLGSNSITLKVTNSTAWNKYVAANKSLFNSTTTAMMPEVEEEEVAEEILTTSVSETTEAVAAFDRSGADALVQSNWGMLNASRAFTDTIGNRTSNRRALGEEQKSSVWMSAMGASSRLSSDGVAAGSDYNLFGAAFGIEQQLTEKSSLGLAIGNSRGKVNSFTSGRTKQDTLHTALYGQHLLQQSTSDALTLDWSAAYGRTESRWNGIEWDQRALQLDARATYAHQLNDTTTVSAFAGLQYYASDSATVAKGCESGSIQNLRGEIGVGIGHRATSKTSIYGELSFVGDMARNNPTATIGEHRVRGANPGRAGINLSAGVNHALNEKWSVNASYNMELMERANSHSANIGASYKF